MKIVSIVAATLLMGSFLVASANEEVNTQIAAIQAATTPEERVELINEFKVLLADMNAEDRQAAIDELRGTLQPLAEDGTALQTRTRTQTRTQARLNDMSQTDQMNQTQQMNQAQQMNQNRMGSMTGTPSGQGMRSNMP